MLSLRDRITNYASQFLDFGDRKPTECSNNELLDTSLPFIPSNSTLDKRISILLSSKATTQVVWALTNIPKLISLDSKSISLNQSMIIQQRETISKYIPQLISFMSSDNLFIEFHSVFCLTIISPAFQNIITKTASDIFLAAINQSKKYPAIEYANLLKAFIPAVNNNILNDNLVPLLFSMLKMNDSYQHFCGYIFSFLPFERISAQPSQLNPNTFTQFYSSNIVATHYLPEIARQASKSPLFGEQWFNQILPQQLLTMGNVQDSIRLAATRTIINNDYNDENKSVSMFVLNAFSWASTNCEICLSLLESANILLSKKKEKFLQKYIDVINKSIKTTNINILKKLPMIFANSPLLFSDQNSQQQLQLFKAVIRKFIKTENYSEPYSSSSASCSQALMKNPSSLTDCSLDVFYINCHTTSNLDNSIEVKIEYLKALPFFISNYKLPQFQEVLFQSFSSFFTDSTMKIFNSKKSISNSSLNEFLDLLIKSPIYSQMNLHMANTIMPYFFNFASSFVHKWRFFDQCMLTYISLSDDHFLFFIERFKPIIIDSMTRNTRPLSKTCIQLLSRLIIISTKNVFSENIRWIIENFSKSKNSDLRSFFINLCSSICFIVKIDIFIENIWPYIIELTKDSSVSVFATLIKNLPKFRRFFRQIHEQSLEWKLVSTFHQIEYAVKSKLNKNKSEDFSQDLLEDNDAAHFEILNGNHISISDFMYLDEVINETRLNLSSIQSDSIESEVNENLNHSAEIFYTEKTPLMNLNPHSLLKKRKSDIRPEVQLVKSSLPLIVRPSPLNTKGGGKKSSLFIQKKGNYQRRLSLLSPKILLKH